MLSSSVSSRLQQFQHQAAGRRRNDLHQLQNERVSVGHSGQTTHARIPARKGLAADLINKFNQLSATPAEAAPSAAHSPARTHSPESSIQKLLVSTLESCKEKEACLSAHKHKHKHKQQQRPLHLPPPSPASIDAPLPPAETCEADNRVQEAAIVHAGDRAMAMADEAAAAAPFLAMPPPAARSRGDSPGGPAGAQARASPFLSDSELDRALSEIHEFSRDMNISLFDDGGV